MHGDIVIFGISTREATPCFNAPADALPGNAIFLRCLPIFRNGTPPRTCAPIRGPWCCPRVSWEARRVSSRLPARSTRTTSTSRGVYATSTSLDQHGSQAHGDFLWVSHSWLDEKGSFGFWSEGQDVSAGIGQTTTSQQRLRFF